MSGSRGSHEQGRGSMEGLRRGVEHRGGWDVGGKQVMCKESNRCSLSEFSGHVHT